MTLTEIQMHLNEMADIKYGDFQAKLIPSINRATVIGVRIPDIRKLAKMLYKSGAYEEFLQDLPHRYHDENLLHALILSEFKSYDDCISELEKFLPYVENWAVCDSISPKCFKKNSVRLIEKITEWSKSSETYTSRFGLEMLMKHFLTEHFKKEYLELAAKVRLKDYYSKMMVAWFFATALTRQWDAAIPYIEEYRLEAWTHNKTIQKARESYCITDEQKEYLKQHRIKSV